jgi:hypothetical protein
MRHSELQTDNIHKPFAFEFLNAATRRANGNYTAAHLNKIALQLDDGTVWMLTNIINPGTNASPRWKNICGNAVNSRAGLNLIPGGTFQIDSLFNNDDMESHELRFNTTTGITATTFTLDITNARKGNTYRMFFQRSNETGNHTVQFVAAGKTFRRSWSAVGQVVGQNQMWRIDGYAESATLFHLFANREY